MEIMVATTILSMMVTIIWMSFSRMLTVRDHVITKQERFQTARIALSRVTRELAQAYLSQHASPDFRTRTLFKAVRDGQMHKLTFSSFGGMKLAENANHSDTVILSYYTKNDPESGGLNLMRREIPRIVQDVPFVENDYPEFVLCDNIARFELEFYDSVANEWVREWDTLGVEKANRLPAMVRIKFGVLDENGKEIVIPTKVRIQMRDALAFGNTFGTR
jgi:general secretion pathway protein J